MLKQPKIKDCYRVQLLEPEHVFLLSERDSTVLSGRLHYVMIPLLTGEHSSLELIQMLDGQVSYPQIIYYLGEMEARGYIIEAGDPDVPKATAALWHQLGVDTATGVERLARTRVQVTALNDLAAGPLDDALQRLDIRQGPDPQLHVVLTDDYLHDELAAINRQAIADGRPWLLVKPGGARLWIGPVFTPESGPCWQCMAQRIEANRQIENYLARRDVQARSPMAAMPATLELGANMAAMEVLKWILLAGGDPLHSSLRTFDWVALESQRHHVAQRPQCPACGRPTRDQPVEPVRLQPHAKNIASSGGRLTVFPEETVARFEHHISPITGVLTWLEETTQDHSGLWYTFSAGHAFPVVQDSMQWLIRSTRSNTGGKGMSRIQAKVSAMGEAFERYSVTYRGEEPVVVGNYDDLAPDAVHLHDCLGFSPKQYADRETWNAALEGTRLHVVPQPFDTAHTMEWAPVWSLTHNRRRLVPAAFCYMGHPESRDTFFCSADSNGCAAGNTLEEAILRGFLELAERDGVALWWYNRIQRQGVDLDSFDLPYLRSLETYYRSLGRTFWVLDLTTDLGIPTFAAVSHRTDRTPQDITLGCSARLDPKSALLGAVAELNQFLPAFSEGADGKVRYNFPDSEAIDWWQQADLESQPYLVPHPDRATKTLADFPSLETDDVKTDIETCVELARNVDLETLVLDITRPDIGMPVARVIVPGLRHFWRRLGPGRLYDVPVASGWLEKPRAEEEMNPFSIFF